MILDLSCNPFSCTCDLKWFLYLLETSNLKSRLNDWSMRYACESPESVKHSLLSVSFFSKTGRRLSKVINLNLLECLKKWTVC